MSFKKKSPPPKPKHTASPEMAAEYWRRNRVFKNISLIMAGVLVVTCIAVKVLVNDKAFAITALVGALIWFGIMTVFNMKFRVCPSCQTVFGRGHRPGRCDHCDTGFPEQPEPKEVLPPA